MEKSLNELEEAVRELRNQLEIFKRLNNETLIYSRKIVNLLDEKPDEVDKDDFPF